MVESKDDEVQRLVMEIVARVAAEYRAFVQVRKEKQFQMETLRGKHDRNVTDFRFAEQGSGKSSSSRCCSAGVSSADAASHSIKIATCARWNM